MYHQKLVSSILIVAAVCISFAAAESDRHTAAGRLRMLSTESDTMEYIVGDFSDKFTTEGLDRHDTTFLPVKEPFILVAGADTLVIQYSSDPTTVLLVFPGDTIIETVVYTDPEYELRRKLEPLRRYPDFGATPADEVGEFRYATPDDSLLARLRMEYNLDSIAGDGPELDRIINLMRWVHTIVRHDGNSTNPSPRTALNLIRICHEEDRGVNCRMMATILNEAYLATGFKSRFVTCLPKDTTDPDCHVTDMVYSETLGKWVYMDPSFEAYFMDEDSVLLGHAEVRQRMINGDPLLLPEGMDHNGDPYDHNSYMAYMAKNMFRFGSPLGGYSGYETADTDRTWVRLNPIGYDTQKTGTADTSGTPGTLQISYFTDNADFFWARP